MPPPEQSCGLADEKMADNPGQSNKTTPASGLFAQGLKIICPSQIVYLLQDDKQNLTA